MADLANSHMLDMGPVSGENITFNALKVGRLYVCDMFLRLVRERSLSENAGPAGPEAPDPPAAYWAHLDYPGETFHAILLWDLLDHLDDEAAARLTQECLRLLKPGGLLMFLAAGDVDPGREVYSYLVRDDFRLGLRRQPHLELDFHFRHTRSLVSLLEPFEQVISFYFRNGTREFLFNKADPKPALHD